MHFCVQTAKFKAFSLNEMSAMVQIVAESEFVCAKRLRIFRKKCLVCHYRQDSKWLAQAESRRRELCLRALRYSRSQAPGLRSQDFVSSTIMIPTARLRPDP